MGKTRGLFNKIGDTKGAFHAKVGTINDRNVKDLKEAEENKKNYTRKAFTTQTSTMA